MAKGKKMGNPPSFQDPGILKPGNNDAAARFNPPSGKGMPIPTFQESTRFGKVVSKDAAARFNPEKP